MRFDPAVSEVWQVTAKRPDGRVIARKRLVLAQGLTRSQAAALVNALRPFFEAYGVYLKAYYRLPKIVPVTP